MKDKFGQELKMGDYIAHATMRGDSADMRISKVLGETTRKDQFTSKRILKLIVWGIEDGLDEIRLGYSKGYISLSDRVIKLPLEIVPEKYRNLLDPITIDTPNDTWLKRYKREKANNV